jgi:hypothetical protein
MGLKKSPTFPNPWRAECSGGALRRAWKELSLCQLLNAAYLMVQLNPGSENLEEKRFRQFHPVQTGISAIPDLD